MHWELSGEQRDFASALRGWLQHHAMSEKVRGWLDSGDCTAFDEAFAAAGWLGVGSPEDLGGQGGGVIELALAAQELGRSVAPSGRWLGAMLALPALAGSLKAPFADDVTTVLAIGAGRIPGNAAPYPLADGGRLEGAVKLVLGADAAQRLVVPAVRRDGVVALFRVDAVGQGVSRVPRRLLDRSRMAADVRFSGAAATELDVDVEQVLHQSAAWAAVLVAADALGCSERMLELSVQYSLQRKQFGVPIGSFQAVKHAAATILVGVEAARSIVLYAAASLDQGAPEAMLAAAAAKAQVTTSAVAAADAALTIHGAVGYTWEHDLQLLYKRAKLDQQLFGAPQEWNERIATALDLVPETRQP